MCLLFSGTPPRPATKNTTNAVAPFLKPLYANRYLDPQSTLQNMDIPTQHVGGFPFFEGTWSPHDPKKMGQ